MKSIDQMMSEMWTDYCAMNPEARRIYDLFVSQGEKILNDHIAFRTFNHPRLGIKSLSQHFERLGYVEKGDYFFKEKKLYAKHYESRDPQQPKIFISELELEKTSNLIQKTVNRLVDQVPDSLIRSENFPYCGRPWEMTYSVYSELAKESEYASWVAAFGFRPNHFTVNINVLKKFNDIKILNEFVKKNGFRLNASGGEIKGTPQDFLEQSSTMANQIPVKFNDGTFSVPACYYEFAKRYPLPNGQLYQGFVAKSADKIFESTNK